MIPPVHLPSARHNEERSAFARGPKERKLRVVVDRATTPTGDMLDLLLEFGDHPLVDLLSTRAEGLSHLDIGPIDTADDQAPTVISHRGTTKTTYTGVWPLRAETGSAGRARQGRSGRAVSARYLSGVADQVKSSFFLTVMVTRPEGARAGLE